MLRSMYSGISGMKVNQTKLDVIGNNIANVNTTSFKSSRATFSDLLSQSTSSAQAASTTKGGINAKQVGLGVQLSSIDRIMTQGSMQSTSRSLDLGLDGNGYFMVSTGPVINGDGAIEVSHKAGAHSINETSLSSSGASISYTRDGSFTLDNEGNLLTTDGYRVLGYSLTNDDSTQAATAQSAGKVTIGGLNFTFGPGTQLNGYKIQLGKIGEGTATSAKLDKTNKIITLNGDFSRGTTLTSEQIQKAISSELAAHGISQSVSVVGNVTSIDNIKSDSKISGGSDAESADVVSCFGYTFKFGTGSDLNGYKIEIGSITSSQGLSADINNTSKTITLNGDFLNTNYNGRAIKEAINNALENSGIETRISDCTGSRSSVSGLTGEVKSITEPKLNTVSYAANSNILGYTVDFTEFGSDLNGMQLVFENDTNASANGKLTVSGTTITLTANFASANLSDLNATIKNTLSGLGYSSSFKLTGTYTAGTNKTATFGSDGSPSTIPTVDIGGFTLNLPSTGSLYNLTNNTTHIDKLKNLKFEVSSINSQNTTVTRDGNTIKIQGNFTSSNGVTASDLADKITRELAGYLGIPESNAKVTVSGNNTTFDNTKTDKIEGGTSLAQGSSLETLGLKFTPTKEAGATLNGYRIQVGNIAAGTKTSVDIDKNGKVITINGDFVNEGAVTKDAIQSVLTKKLNETFGSDVNINVEDSGTILNLNGSTESEIIQGGTSVQSIGTDGTINYVSASTDVYAYDGSLKTLKIPEKVISGDGTEVAVKSYSISSNGIITATLEDGTIAALGQIALASFSNPAGLTSVGGNLYTVSSNSGAATIMSGIGTTGDDNSDAYADMLSGYLEMSNVDLAEQFTDMITTTKAFQGAAKMITTGDDILTEIINLKR